MVDEAIKKIGDVHNISFQWFRDSIKKDHNSKPLLDYGHAVIDSVPMLDQYLYSYGPMIESQWKCLDAYLAAITPPSRIIDYGCGQGLAGLLMNELTQGGLFTKVVDILLIEPSAMALARAEAIYKRIAPHAAITCICKRFDDVVGDDILAENHQDTMHVFSNTLDVPRFSALPLFEKTIQSGRHTVLSVSHDRTFNGGTPRIESVKAAFEDPSQASALTIFRSDIQKFTCDNPSQSKGVVWLCQLEMHDA